MSNPSDLMMKTDRPRYNIEINGAKAIFGIPRDATISISLGGDHKQYSAPIEKVHAAISRWHRKENSPAAKRKQKSALATTEARMISAAMFAIDQAGIEQANEFALMARRAYRQAAKSTGL